MPLFPPMVAFDGAGTVVRSGSGQVYAPTDTTYSTPLAVTDINGNALTAIAITDLGTTVPFNTPAGVYLVVWKSGNLPGIVLFSPEGAVDAAEQAVVVAQEARGAAQTAQAAAEAAAAAAQDAGGSTGSTLTLGTNFDQAARGNHTHDDIYTRSTDLVGALIFKGDYANNFQYRTNHVVLSGPSADRGLYRARRDHLSAPTGGAPTGDGDTTYWQLIAKLTGGTGSGNGITTIDLTNVPAGYTHTILYSAVTASRPTSRTDVYILILFGTENDPDPAWMLVGDRRLIEAA